MRIRYGLPALALLLGTLAEGAPPLTSIEDVLYRADGSKFTGVAFIEWKSFQAADLSNVATQSLTVLIQDGVIRVRLVPTTNATPSAYYRVRYHSDGRVQFNETWAVPPSSVKLALKDVRVTSASTGGTVQPPPIEQILESDVIGLTEDLEARPLKGPGFAPARTAFITDMGMIEAVAGSLTDCVRVDGTAGPCDLLTSVGPGFVDSEVPAGAMNGVNLSFALSQVPSPPASLSLFRNGILQKEGLDFTLIDNVIEFVPATAPQAGDVLTASFRLADASNPVAAAGGALSGTYPNPSLAQGVISDYNISDVAGISEAKLALSFPTHAASNDPTADQKAALVGTAGTPSASNRYVTEQDSRIAGLGRSEVLCSASGTGTSSAALTSLGSCAIPAGTLAAGDRVEVAFSYTHEGSNQAPAFEIRWGSTALVSRSGANSETRIVGKAEVGLHDSGAVWGVQSWGASLSFATGTGSTTDAPGAAVIVDFLGRMVNGSSNTVTLRNFTVLRHPARINP